MFFFEFQVATCQFEGTRESGPQLKMPSQLNAWAWTRYGQIGIIYLPAFLSSWDKIVSATVVAAVTKTPRPTMMYTIVKIFPAAVSGEKLPNPTVEIVTTEK